MKRKDWKRHEHRKNRRHDGGGDTEPELSGTRMAVLPFGDGAQVRRLEIDATDPLPVVVRWCRRALLEAAPIECIRLLVVKNWDADRRELFDIPEAREYFRRLWVEAKPLLRLLSESTSAPTPDDSYGFPPEVLSGLGLGWLDVYLLGFCDVVERELVEGQAGPAYRLAVEGMTSTTRARLREELLEVSDENPAGGTFDAAAQRADLMRRHESQLYAAARELAAAGGADSVLVVASMLDQVGREIAVACGGQQAARDNLQRCQEDELHPAAVVAVPRAKAVELGLFSFAPQAAAILAEQLPAGVFWVVTIAAGGTQTGKLRLSEEVAK